MAPRKDATAPVPSPSQTQQDASSDGIEDFEIPRTLVAQLARSALPKDVRLKDETVTALMKGSTVFINYLTAAAQDIAASRAHKTISGADVLKALEMLEFGDVVGNFQNELEAFRQGNKADKGKNKIVLDLRGKGKDKLSPSGSGSSSAKPIATSSVDNHDPQESGEADAQRSMNGISSMDVDMEDATEETEELPPPGVAKPITLPIE